MENAACELRNALPAEFGNQFKVVEYALYLQIPSTTPRVPPMFEQIKTVAATESQYYLLITKQTDTSGIYTKFWIDLKLPQTGAFSCLTASKQMLIQETVAFKIEEKYTQLDRNPFQYAEAEIAGINYLKTVFSSILSGNCCPISRIEIEGLLLSKGYDKVPARFMDIPSGAKPVPMQNRMPGLVENYANLLCEIQGVDGFENFQYTLEDEVANAVRAGVNAKAYITKDQNFCDDIGTQILNGFSDNVFIHLHFSPDPESLKPGSLFRKIKKD